MCLLLCMMLSCITVKAEVPAAQTAECVTMQQHIDTTNAKMMSVNHFSCISINRGCSRRLPKALWATGTKISYSSSDNKVVSVNSKGIIRGNKTGSAVVTIKVMSRTQITYVRVRVRVYKCR